MSIADKLQTIAANEQRVFDAGKKAAYDAFWDTFQQSGNRSNYINAFCGGGWTPTTLKPKYKCVPTGANNMFYLCGFDNNQGVIDFREIADKIDFSKATSAVNLFYSANVDFITVDFSSATNLGAAFNGAYCSSLTTLTLKVTPKTTDVSGIFNYANTLTNLTFTDDSEISCNGFNFQWSPLLTKESITSVVNALSPNTTGLTVTFSTTAVNNAFTTEEWEALVATKPNWTIAHY